MRDLHWTLDSLPPHLRAQAEKQLNAQTSKLPHAAPPRGVGLIKVNSVPQTTTPQEPDFLDFSKEGLTSIAQVRAEKKASKKRKTLTPDMADNLVSSCSTSPDGNEIKIKLDIDCYQLPTAQQKGTCVGNDGRVHFFTKAKVAKAQKTLVKALSPYAHLVNAWGQVPIAVQVDFCFPFPKSTPKKELVQFSYHITRPDADNLYKGFCDSLTEAKFWNDDSQVADIHLRKFRVLDKPYISLTITKLPPVLPGFDLFFPEASSSPTPTT